MLKIHIPKKNVTISFQEKKEEKRKKGRERKKENGKEREKEDPILKKNRKKDSFRVYTALITRSHETLESREEAKREREEERGRKKKKK